LISSALGLLLALAGCGDEKRPSTPPIGWMPRDGGDADGGALDGGDADGGELDAGELDAGDLDGGNVDGGDPDAGCALPDGGCGMGATGCRLEGSVVELGTDARDFDARAVDVVYSGDAFWFGWAQSGGVISTVQVHRWPLVGAASTFALTPDRARHRDVQLAPTPEGGVAAAWIDNGGVGFQVYGRAVGPGGSLGAPAVPWTADLLTHQALDVVATGAGFLASWAQSDGLGGTSVVAVVPSGATLAPTAPIAALDTVAVSPLRTALAPSSTGATLAWSTTGDVSIVPVSAAGAPTGTPTVLTTERNGDGTVAVAQGIEAFGVLVAGALPQIRVREFDPSGAPAGSERIVTSPPTQGIEPGVAAFSPGWLVAYRALPDGTLMTPTIRISYVTRFGSPNAIFDVASTSREGGPVRIATAPDGRVAVAWAERRSADVALYAARFVCD
jgi:hypothetical protein